MKKYIISTGLILLCLLIAFLSWEKYSNEMQAFTLHMLWNNAYNTSQENDKEKKKYLEEALQYYSWSLSLRENQDTRYNYELVEKLLQDIEEQNKESKQEKSKKQEKNQEDKEKQWKSWKWEKQDWKSWDSQKKDTEWKSEDSQKESTQGNSGESKQSWNSSEGSWEKNQQKWLSSWQRGEDYLLQESQKIDNLTKQEKESLKKITEQLKQEQIYNQKYFWKKQQKSDFTNIIDNFFGTLDRGGEKDW